MTETYIKVDRQHTQHIDQRYYHAFTQQSRYVQLYPGDTHSKWGEIIDAWPAGIKLRITRVQNNLCALDMVPITKDAPQAIGLATSITS